MKKVLISFLLYSVFTALTWAADPATHVKKEHPSVHYLKTWHVITPLAIADSIPVDTLHVNYQNDNPTNRYSIANSFNGNLGSPLQSKIYFVRPQNSRFIFGDAYDAFIARPENVVYYNTKNPYSNISYNGGFLTQYRDEDNIKFLFTANANKKLNFGTALDYIHAKGVYEMQTSDRFAGTIFGSYDGKRYKASGAIMHNTMKNYENGGLKVPNDIHSDIYTKTTDIPTNLDGSTSAYGQYYYTALIYNHSYNIGFNKEVKVSEDSVRTEYVPVTSFGHTIKLSNERKRYLERIANTTFYPNTYYSNVLTRDTAALQTISNIVSLSIEEDFNKWIPFGLSAYLSNDIEQYTLTTDSAQYGHVTRSRTKLGGVLSRTKGSHFRYNVLAEIDLIGAQIGDFKVDGTLGGFFRLWKDSVALTARGYIKNDRPSFFMERYNSNHFRWNNDFKQIYRTGISGNFAIPTRAFSLNVSVENVTNLVYFDKQALPAQFEGNIQVLSANLKQDFKFWKMHLDNNIVYQVSSAQDILPLPTLALYHNLYYVDRWLKVLGVQIGVDMHYHSAYYAPAYMPATGQFYTQDQTKIGNFPVMNVYMNFYLQQVRFFIKYYHVNNLFMKTDYFSMPGYPVNPAVFRVGLSWNFFN